jgi:DNA mismatch repair protein MutH
MSSTTLSLSTPPKTAFDSSKKQSRKRSAKPSAHNTTVKECRIFERPCIQQVYDKVVEIANIHHTLPKTANKGKPGNYLEELTGIPTSSECLDCTDGEVKVFPLKKIKKGDFTPKETIAVTMISKDTLKNDTFENSRCFKKMSKILYVPYYREGDDISYFNPTIIDLKDDKNRELLNQLKADYDAIRDYFIKNDNLERSSKLGVYLQNRTKGAGKGAPKTRAFYLRPKFIKDFIKLAA